MNKALETLKARGFFAQCTDEQALSDRMDKGPVTFYVGCDPTGPSLHIGHMVPFFALRHLRKFGHRGIALIGGGTARIGDPSGKTEMRKMITYEQIDSNAANIKKQLDKFIGFDDKTAYSVNNKDWLADMNYIDFLRDVGSCFSVNKMLQAYDFHQLHVRHGCDLQIGGDDQWGNITAGVDLIRRKCGGTEESNAEHQVFGLTFPLITRADGKKMGKTEKGAIFLDESLTSVFDFFQYWRNVADPDVEKFFKLFTFLELDEISEICKGDINAAKERLAFEVTKIIHGEEKANSALAGAKAAFSGEGDKTQMPSIEISKADVENGVGILNLFVQAGLCSSNGEARKLIIGNGASLNGEKITDPTLKVTSANLDADGEIVLKSGKKKFCRIVLK